MTDRDTARALLRELLPEILGEVTTAPRATGHNGNGHRPAPPAADPTRDAPAAARGVPATARGVPATARGVPAADPTPVVPAPPTAAVMRPSTWSAPPAPGEVVGPSLAAPLAAPVVAPLRVTTPPPKSNHAASRRGDRESLRERGAPAASLRGRVESVVLESDADVDAFVRSLLARFENPRDRMAIRAGHLRFALRRADVGGASGAVLRVERGAVTERKVREAADAGARLVLAPAAVLTPLARERARALKVEIEKERRC
jgi:hypothetical protein